MCIDFCEHLCYNIRKLVPPVQQPAGQLLRGVGTFLCKEFSSCAAFCFGGNMKISMGTTKIVCVHCSTITEVKNEDLETAREFVCPVCKIRMTDHEFIRMKAHYCAILLSMYNDSFGKPRKRFLYDINVFPHYLDAETEQSEENGNREGG